MKKPPIYRPSFIDSPRRVEFFKHRRTNIYGRDWKGDILGLFTKLHLTITSHNFAVPLARTAKRLVSFYKAHRPKHIDIHIKITLTRVIILGLLAFNFYPHTSHTAAIGSPVASKLYSVPSDIKPLKQPDLSPQSEVAVYVAPKPVITYPSSCSDPKSCIYSHESGNDPTKYNGSGCLGLGQACPASKLLAVCPTMDYSCEDSWFTGYMISRYGTWANAWAIWQNQGWW